MSTKHLYDSAEGLVLKSLRGAVRLNPGLCLYAQSKSVYVQSPSSSLKVGVISGGGAGHEPAHASYTGKGMLQASVSGDIFASPSAKQILNTIKLAAYTGDSIPRDVLVIINNYTGDRLNFGLAIEKARATLPGIHLESVVVADDVSLLKGESGGSPVGPRGLAGNILVCKLVGALAERGEPLHVLKGFGDAVVANLSSIGVGLDHCHVPGREHGESLLGPHECEVGLGLHNEAGVMKKQMEDVESLVTQMLGLILESHDVGPGLGLNSTSFIGAEGSGEREEVVLFVNNLGGMSQLEMGAVLDEIAGQLAALGIHPRRIYLSSFMTSLNAPGFSISLLNISAVHRQLSQPTNSPINVLDLLDDPTDALAWAGVRVHWPTRCVPRDLAAEDAATERVLVELSSVEDEPQIIQEADSELNWWTNADVSPTIFESAIRQACNAVLDVEKELTAFDTEVGDGDCGETFSAGAKAVISALDNGQIKIGDSDPSMLIRSVAEILEDNMGGTVGALFGIYFNALSVSLIQQGRLSISWPTALGEAQQALSKHTPARPGDRTLMDALVPFISCMGAGGGLGAAVQAAKEGAESTRGMKPRLGRAAYMSEEKYAGLPPDPGAWGIAALLHGFLDGLSEWPRGHRIN